MISRYAFTHSCMPFTPGGNVVYYKDHLADKKAALAAQAEGHESTLEALRTNLINCHNAEFNRIRTQHAAELAALRGEGEPALIHYERTRLIGEPCMIHRAALLMMKRLCDIAADCEVELWVTHSMRRLNQKLFGKVVEEAERSNHHAGSAVDLNPVYQGVWYTNAMMEDMESLPTPVQLFLNTVGFGEDLRWGGQFGINKDRVHFDDNLVLRDPDEWARRVRQLQEKS